MIDPFDCVTPDKFLRILNERVEEIKDGWTEQNMLFYVIFPDQEDAVEIMIRVSGGHEVSRLEMEEGDELPAF